MLEKDILCTTPCIFPENSVALNFILKERNSEKNVKQLVPKHFLVYKPISKLCYARLFYIVHHFYCVHTLAQHEYFMNGSFLRLIENFY